VLHAVGANATGPWLKVGIAVPTEAHNPVLSRDPTDGTWLLFTMGCPHDNSADPSCAKTNVSCGPRGSGAYWTTTVYSSQSLYGPWVPTVDLLGNISVGHQGSQNVAPMFAADGSITLMFKGLDNGTETSLAVAPHWRGACDPG
jgi:hypothetical protein